MPFAFPFCSAFILPVLHSPVSVAVCEKPSVKMAVTEIPHNLLTNGCQSVAFTLQFGRQYEVACTYVRLWYVEISAWVATSSRDEASPWWRRAIQLKSVPLWRRLVPGACLGDHSVTGRWRTWGIGVPSQRRTYADGCNWHPDAVATIRGKSCPGVDTEEWRLHGTVV